MKNIIYLILSILILSSCKIEVSNSVRVNSHSTSNVISSTNDISESSTSSTPVINENCECNECFYCLLNFNIDNILFIKISESVYNSSGIKIKEELYEEILKIVNVKYTKIEYDEQYTLDSSPMIDFRFSQGDNEPMMPLAFIYFNKINFKMYLVASKLDSMYESKETYDVEKIEEFEDKCNAHWE